MKARTQGWREPRSRTRRYATGTRPRRRANTAKARSGTRWRGPGPDSCSVRPAAWHPLWLKWRASLGETHLPDAPIPPAQTPLGGGVPDRQALRFRPEPGEPVPQPGRRDAEGGGAAPQEGLHINPMEEDPGNRGGNRPGGVIRMPAKPPIPGLRSSP